MFKSVAALTVGAFAASDMVYTVDLESINDSTATGSATVFAGTDKLSGIGMASGLESAISDIAGNCTATNACGVHIHSGYACDNSTTQGGHYFAEGETDPWASIIYTETDEAGDAMFQFSGLTALTDIEGKPFIVHDSTGARVACGLLALQENNVFAAETEAINGADTTGSVTLYTMGDKIVGSGMAMNLEADLNDMDGNCTATNGCGVHVHAGYACDNSTTQGGHYFAEGAEDPWATVRYSETDMNGNAMFIFEVESAGATDIEDKPFIIHSNDGGRVSCGILASTAESPTPEVPTPESPTPESPTPESPTPEEPTPEEPTPEEPTPEGPTPEEPTPESSAAAATVSFAVVAVVALTL